VKRGNTTLNPPSWHFRSPVWEFCWDRTSDILVCRDLRGAEEVPATGAYNYTVPASAVVKAQYHGFHGAQFGTKSGNFYEGCQRRDDAYWRCDYFVPNPNYHLVRHTNTNFAYWLRALGDWADGAVYQQVPCVTSIVGNWVGAAQPESILIDCWSEPYQRS
jgi:hypothetical protein